MGYDTIPFRVFFFFCFLPLPLLLLHEDETVGKLMAFELGSMGGDSIHHAERGHTNIRRDDRLYSAATDAGFKAWVGRDDTPGFRSNALLYV